MQIRCNLHKLWDSTCYVYLPLAISDNIVLLAESLIWISEYPIEIKWISTTNGLCKATYYFRYAGRLWSALLTLSVTGERYLFVAHPLKSAYLRTPKNCKIGIILTGLVSFVLAMYAIFLIKLDDHSASNGLECSIAVATKHRFVVADIVISRCLADVTVGFIIFCFTGLYNGRFVSFSNIEKNKIQ